MLGPCAVAKYVAEKKNSPGFFGLGWDVVRLQHTMNDGNVRTGNLVYGDVASMIPLVWGIGEEQKIATVECRFHGSAMGTYKPSSITAAVV